MCLLHSAVQRRCFLWKLWVMQPAVARQPHKEMSISGLMDGIFSAMKLQLFISLIPSVILFIPGEVFSERVNTPLFSVLNTALVNKWTPPV